MKEAKIKAGRYCAYQERTQQEVCDKLYGFGLRSDEVEEVLTELITEGFVNEARFARAYASDKFRLNKWGRKKITYILMQKGLSQNSIDEALTVIPEDDYLSTLKHLINSRIPDLPAAKLAEKQKAANYLIGKGFESDIVWSKLNE